MAAPRGGAARKGRGGAGAAGCHLGSGVGDTGVRGVREGYWRLGRTYSGIGNRGRVSVDVANGKERWRVTVPEGSLTGAVVTRGVFFCGGEVV